jgi:hypothetical protein
MFRSSSAPLPLSVFARSHRPLAVLPLATSLFLAACGGRSDVQPIGSSPSGECPAGYVCTPTCPTGDVCNPVGSTSGTGGSNTGTGSSTGSGSTSNSPDAGAPSTIGSSPEDAGYPEGSAPAASATLQVLTYEVIDAKFSVALSSLVLVSSAPSNALHIYAPSTGSDRAVALPAAPAAVTIDASGLHAAVAYDGNVSWVDLASGAVTATCPISSDAYDIALTAEGTACVMPRTDQWVSLHAIDSTCTETVEEYGVWAGSHIALHPSEKALFTADQGLSPSSINRCDLTVSPVGCVEALGGTDWGTYAFCGSLWISADGQRIYSGCGVTLRVPGDPTTDLCSYGGTLAGVSLIQHLSEAPQAKRVVLIPGNGYSYDPTNAPATNDTVVRVQETDYLGFVSQYELPRFPLAGTSSGVAHGRFVFTTPTMDTIFAVVQADGSSGALNDFAIVTMVP